jgi:hypothetical protein
MPLFQSDVYPTLLIRIYDRLRSKIYYRDRQVKANRISTVQVAVETQPSFELQIIHVLTQ